MATAVEIRERAARRLALTGQGSTTPSYHAVQLDQAYVEIYAQLSAKNVAVWDFADDVPDEYAPHVVAMVAYSRVSDYPIHPERLRILAVDQIRAIPEMRELTSSDVYTQQQVDYF